MSRFWVIKDEAGRVQQQIVHPVHPCSGVLPAYCFDVTRVQEVNRLGDMSSEVLVDGYWQQDADLVEQQTLKKLDHARMKHLNILLSQGEAIKLVYARKGSEARDYLARTYEDRQDDIERRWPYIAETAKWTGETMLAAALRIEAAMVTSEAPIRTIEAKADAARRAVRAATSAGEKLSAAAEFLAEYP